MTTTVSTALKHAYRCAGTLVVFAIVMTLLMSFTHLLTFPLIHAHDREQMEQTIEELIPLNNHTYDIIPQEHMALKAFGQQAAFTLFHIIPHHIDMGAQSPHIGLVLPIVAPDGYGGPIQLLLALNQENLIWGIRVTQHHETPGLGDYIDPEHPFPHHQHRWQAQWTQLSLHQTSDWDIKRNGGYFDAVAGASISPQAVIHAVHRAMQYLQAHPELFRPGVNAHGR